MGPGYFSLNHARMGGMQDFFGQLWKEYAMSDSRYLTSDPFVLCMETVTAVCSSFMSDLDALDYIADARTSVSLGAPIVRCCLAHNDPTPPSVSFTSLGIHRADIW